MIGSGPFIKFNSEMNRVLNQYGDDKSCGQSVLYHLGVPIEIITATEKKIKEDDKGFDDNNMLDAINNYEKEFSHESTYKYYSEYIKTILSENNLFNSTDNFVIYFGAGPNGTYAYDKISSNLKELYTNQQSILSALIGIITIFIPPSTMTVFGIDWFDENKEYGHWTIIGKKDDGTPFIVETQKIIDSIICQKIYSGVDKIIEYLTYLTNLKIQYFIMILGGKIILNREKYIPQYKINERIFIKNNRDDTDSDDCTNRDRDHCRDKIYSNPRRDEGGKKTKKQKNKKTKKQKTKNKKNKKKIKNKK